MKYKRPLVALLVALLPACSTVKYVRELPPVELLADCPEVVERVKTNGQLVETILDYRASLSTCNTDKEALRKWSEQ